MLGAGWPRSPKPKMMPSTCSASSSLSKVALHPSLGETRVTLRELAGEPRVGRLVEIYSQNQSRDR